MKVPSIWVTIGKRGFSSPESFARLLNYNITAVRLNTGHNTFEWLKNSIETLISIGFWQDRILVDIGNTKPRIIISQDNQLKIESGTKLYVAGTDCNASNIFLNNQEFFSIVESGDLVYFGDGEVECRVIQKEYSNVVLEAISNGCLQNGIAIGVKGKRFCHFHVEQQQILEITSLLKTYKVGIILSFVESADNVRWAKSVFSNASVIIPKIETASAVRNIDDILSEASTIFIGRGDLALDIGIEKIGVVQKAIIEKAKKHGCTVSVGSGTLESLNYSKIPFRAEIIDITNSAFSGVDYIVLTSETGRAASPYYIIEHLSKVLDYLSTI